MNIVSSLFCSAAVGVLVLALSGCDQVTEIKGYFSGKSPEQVALEQKAMDALMGKGMRSFTVGSGLPMHIDGVEIVPVGDKPCNATDKPDDPKCVVFDHDNKTVKVSYKQPDGSVITEDWSVNWTDVGLQVSRQNGQEVSIW